MPTGTADRPASAWGRLERALATTVGSILAFAGRAAVLAVLVGVHWRKKHVP